MTGVRFFHSDPGEHRQFDLPDLHVIVSCDVERHHMRINTRVKTDDSVAVFLGDKINIPSNEKQRY